MDKRAPEFISQSILTRLKEGSFVAARRSRRESVRVGDRRNTVSPLAITKRCIRYDPTVFDNRRDLIIEMSKGLNDPEKKILLLSGVQGSGKTSLARGVIELMGGQSEQLLWFDVNRHTDFEEIIQFLIQYATYIGDSFAVSVENLPEEPTQNVFARLVSPKNTSQQPQSQDPLQRLTMLLGNIAHVPLLIVIDNIEYIVDGDFRFNSFPFKEMLNFLLGFPNIKMILVGERMPYADMSPNQPGVLEIKLAELALTDVAAFMAKSPEPVPAEVLESLYRKSLGLPWLLKVLQHLNHQLATETEALDKSLGEDNASLADGLTRHVFERLSTEERRVFQLMAMLRHPVNLQTLLALTRFCYPDLAGSADEMVKNLDHSLIRHLVKVSYPPQQVLAQIRQSLEAASDEQSSELARKNKYQPWYELYHQIKKAMHQGMGDGSRNRLHALLQDFYLKEKNQPALERITGLKTRALLAEAKHHNMATRTRRAEPAEAISIETRAYLDAQSAPGALTPDKPYTLADYRKIRLDDGENPLPEPDTLDLNLNLAGVELSDEEKRLLFGDEWAVLREPPQEVTLSQQPALVEHPLDLVGLRLNTQGADEEDETEKAIFKRLNDSVVRHHRPDFVRELLELARYRVSKGLLDRAEACLDKALSMPESAPDDVRAALCALQGSIHKQTFRHNSALTLSQRAAECFLKALDAGLLSPEVGHGELGRVYQDLGEIFSYRHQHSEALQSYAQALESYTRCGNTARQAEAYFLMACIYDDQNDSLQALKYFQHSLALDRQAGNEVSCAATLANIGGIQLELKHYDEALAAFWESLRYDKLTHHTEGQMNTLVSLAQVYLEQDEPEPERAEAMYKKALSIALNEGSSIWKANLYLYLGTFYAARRDWEKALLHYQAAKAGGEGELSQSSLNIIEERIQEVHRVIHSP